MTKVRKKEDYEVHHTNIKYFPGIILVVCFHLSLNGQILQDTTTLSLLKKGVDNIYNGEFSRPGWRFQSLNPIIPGIPSSTYSGE